MILDKSDPNFEFSDDYFQYKLDTKSFDKEDFWEFIDAFKYETEYGEKRRWSRSAITYCEFRGKFYVCEWDQGLTECQEDEWYGDQPYEVIPGEKTVVIRTWERV